MSAPLPRSTTWQDLLAAMPVATVAVAADATIVAANRLALDLLGDPEAVGAPLRLHPGCDVAALPSTRAISSGEPQQGTLPLVDRELAVQTAPAPADWGPLALMTLAPPVVPSAAGLRRREQLLKLAETLAGVGVWEVDVATGTAVWSETTKRIHDVPETAQPTLAEAIEFYTPEARPIVDSVVSRCVAEGTPWEFELPAVTATGRPIWLRAVGQAEYHDGQPVRLIGAVQDITTRKVAEMELSRSEERLQRAVEGAEHGVWDWDSRTNAVYLAPGWCERVGWNAASGRIDELIQRVEPTDRELLLAAAAQAKAGDASTFEQDIRAQTTAGQRWVTVRGRGVYGAGGELERLVGTLTDVTERRSAAAERARLERALTEASHERTIGRIASGIAHDFNNMLMVISTNAEFAGTAEDVEERDACLSQIRDAAARSTSLTRHLLAYARRAPTRPTRVDVNAALTASMPFLRHAVGERATLRWHPSPQPAPVLIDPTQLDQVVMNLVLNARDATGPSGTLTLSTEVQDLPAIQGQASGRHVVIHVQDDGPGIPADVRPHIFEPYFSTKSPRDGTGLGLATVYGVVRQQGGSIQVTTAPGAGTTMHVLLPVLDAAGPQVPEVPTRPAPRAVGHHPVVLLVDDDPHVLASTQQLLKNLGYEALAASSGTEAIEQLVRDGRRVSVVLTDVVMPGMNGIELAAALHTLRPDLPVVFMSGYPAAMLDADGALPPGVRLLAKPFTSQELADELNKLLTAP